MEIVNTVLRFVWGPFLNGFCVHLILPGLLILPFLILSSRIGASLGVPRLFWRENAPWSQLVIGSGVGALIWQTLLAGYLFEEFATNYTLDRTPFCETPDPSIEPHRFIHPPASTLSFLIYSGGILLSGAGFLLMLWWVASLIRATSLKSTSTDDKVQNQRASSFHPTLMWPLPIGVAVGLALMGLVSSLAFARPAVAAYVGNQLVRAGGWGAAAGRQSVVDRAEDYANRGIQNPTAEENTQLRNEETKKTRDRLEPYFPVYGLFLINFLLFVLVFALTLAIPAARRLFSPAVGILFLLELVLAGFVIFSFFTAAPSLVITLSVALAILGGLTRYKQQFPKIDRQGESGSYYDAPVDLPAYYEATSSQKGAPEETKAGVKRLLKTQDIGFTGLDQKKKPLVIVCTSGGGSRAAAWTIKVLTELERVFGDKANSQTHPPTPVSFPYHIRLITGASGGMLGASYYVASLEAPDPSKPGIINRRVDQHKSIDINTLNENIRGDFLTPIIHTMITHDLPSVFWPVKGTTDRGREAEAAFNQGLDHQMETTFEDLRAGEEEGWRPSLIFSPMLVEDGRQLLISNLDLQTVTENRGPILGESGGLFSRDSIEFFRLFPEATRFQVGTAARMSASFPYIFPAVELPTTPSRRVVDAGYYDNFGVFVASSWILNNMRWLAENATGVVLIEIRDGVSEEARRREKVTDPPTPLAERGLRWLSSPFEGLMSARIASSEFRNDNLLALVARHFEDQRYGQDFFTTVAFEFQKDSDVSLSFYLSETEKKMIDESNGWTPNSGGDRTAFEAQVDALLRWWANHS